MRCIPGITITAAVLTSTTAPEVAPAVWSSGTTYAAGDQCSISGANKLRTVYQSLVGANLNHDPATDDGTRWKRIGDTYETWASGTSYAKGDVVIKTSTHTEYESLVASNLNNDPEIDDGTKWLVRGPTNAWRMFDRERNTATTTTSPLVVVLEPGQRVDAVGLAGLVADSVTLTVTKDGVTIYSRTASLNARNVATWYQWLTTPFIFRRELGFFDLPPVTDAIVALTFERATGDVSVGGLAIDRAVYLGGVQYDAQAEYRNYSEVTRDDFGNATLVKRRSIPTTTQTLIVPTKILRTVWRLMQDIDATVAFWSALDDDAQPYFEPFVIMGFITKAQVVARYPEHAVLALDLEEV